MAASSSYVVELNRRVEEIKKTLDFCKERGKIAPEFLRVLQYMVDTKNTDLQDVAGKLKLDEDILFMKFNALSKLRDTGEEGVLNYKELMSCFRPIHDTTVVSSTGVGLFHPADASTSASTPSDLQISAIQP
jgi:hypothetical protein